MSLVEGVGVWIKGFGLVVLCIRVFWPVTLDRMNEVDILGHKADTPGTARGDLFSSAGMCWQGFSDGGLLMLRFM